MIPTVDKAALVVTDYIGRKRLPNDPVAVTEDLHSAGLLDEGWARYPNPVQAAVNILGCRMSWSDAAAIAATLSDAGLLVTPTDAEVA